MSGISQTALPVLFDHFEHGGDVVFGDGLRHTAGAGVAVAREGAHRTGHARALGVGFAGHDGGDGTAKGAAFDAVVTVAVAHDEGAEVGVAEAEGAEDVGILGDFLDRVAGVIDDDLLGGNEDADGGFEALDIEGAVFPLELHQVE